MSQGGSSFRAKMLCGQALLRVDRVWGHPWTNSSWHNSRTINEKILGIYIFGIFSTTFNTEVSVKRLPGSQSMSGNITWFLRYWLLGHNPLAHGRLSNEAASWGKILVLMLGPHMGIAQLTPISSIVTTFLMVPSKMSRYAQTYLSLSIFPKISIIKSKDYRISH